MGRTYARYVCKSVTFHVEARIAMAKRGRGLYDFGIMQAGRRKTLKSVYIWTCWTAAQACRRMLDRVDPTRIDRMFRSLVAPGYAKGSAGLFPAQSKPLWRSATIRCDGSGSVLTINDAGARIDCASRLPRRPVQRATRRIVEAVEWLGYRGIISHLRGRAIISRLPARGNSNGAGR
jgi:hypothetical protein